MIFCWLINGAGIISENPDPAALVFPPWLLVFIGFGFFKLLAMLFWATYCGDSWFYPHTRFAGLTPGCYCCYCPNKLFVLRLEAIFFGYYKLEVGVACRNDGDT